ncbi:MAG: MerR family transcriptional regulator [Actinomycetota bacterium]|nr:MerR family transcriptional regulator [Actinomycetota bacterium]
MATMGPGDVASALGVSRATVRRLMLDGTLTPTETSPGGWRRYSTVDVAKLARARRAAGGRRGQESTYAQCGLLRADDEVEVVSDACQGEIAEAVDVLGVPDSERPSSRGHPVSIPRLGPIVTYRDLRVMPLSRDVVSGPFGV